MRTEGKLSVYERIVERIKRDIALGILEKDEKLPSCRELALEMGVNPNTVQHAYSTLEEQGVIYTLPKKGVYVKGHNSTDLLKEAEKQLRLLAAAGISKTEFQKLIDTVFSEEKND